MSWIEIAVAPLTELNPVKYAFDQAYRHRADVLLGRRAKRIFVYQTLLAMGTVLAGAAAIAIWLLPQ